MKRKCNEIRDRLVNKGNCYYQVVEMAIDPFFMETRFFMSMAAGRSIPVIGKGIMDICFGCNADGE